MSRGIIHTKKLIRLPYIQLLQEKQNHILSYSVCKIMRKGLLFFPVLALAIAGCSTNDEFVDLNNSDSTLLPNNSVAFTNNTILTIGSETESSRALVNFSRSSFGGYINDACQLDMEEAPTAIPSEGIIVDDELVIHNDNAYDNASIYVKPSGKLIVESDIAKIASITVLEGGQMYFSGKGIDGVKLLCYGDLKITSDDVIIAKDASVKTTGNLTVDGSLNLKDGELYVGGDLTCTILNVDQTASWHKTTALHVMGNLTQVKAEKNKDVITFGNKTVACIEGVLLADNVDILTESNVHVDCKLCVKNELNINSATLNAGYIDMSASSSYATLDWSATINLPAGGVGDFANLDFNRDNVNWGIIGTGNAFINSVNLRIKSDKTIFNINPGYYLSYQKLYVGNSSENQYRLVGPGKAVEGNDIETDTELINVEGVKINTPEGSNSCNPGFSVPDTDPDTDPDTNPDTDPEPEPEPDGDKIVIEIPDGIEDEWFLKADDFAIRVDGIYEEDIKIKDGIESLDGVKITEENLKVTVSGTGNLATNHEYTYEVWLWVSEETWKSFSDSQKAAWVSGDGNGTDITDLCKVTAPNGYVVRKNVYKGLSGHADTPYIKVSIHITKEDI